MKNGMILTIVIYWNSYYLYENIEVIQTINSNRNNLLDLNLNTLFQEYSKKI